MDVLGDLLARDRRSDDTALEADRREYDYRRFLTSAWKTGNYLRHLGIRTGARVVVADDPAPEPVLSLYGTAALGGVVTFEPDPEARAAVAPTPDVEEYDLPPGGQRVGYGSRPENPAVGHFERDVWSENPTEPPDRVEPDDAVLAAAGESYTHATVLEAARTVADRWSLDRGDVVAVRTPFARPGAVVAGLVAPILAGAAILLPGESEMEGDYAVGERGPEPERLDPDAILYSTD